MADVADLPIAGRIVTAAGSDWDEARHAWNLTADQRPAAVAFVGKRRRRLGRHRVCR